MRVRDQAAFYARLASLFKAGISMGQALEKIAKGSGVQASSELARAVLEAIDTGESPSRGWEAAGAPDLDIGILALAEETGRFSEACELLAVHYEWRMEVRQLWISGFFSPLMALIIGLVAYHGTLFFVVGAGAALASFVWVLTAFGAAWGLWYLLLQSAGSSEAAKVLVARISLSLPVFGGILLNLTRSRFFELAGEVYSSGGTLARAVELAAKGCGNAYLCQRLQDRSSHLVGSGSLSTFLKGESIVDPLGLEVIETGEESGQLEACLLRVAKRYRDEGQKALEQRVPVVARILTVPIVVVVFFFCVLNLSIAVFGKIWGMLAKSLPFNP